MRSADDPEVFVIPATTVGGVLKLVEEKLKVHSYRVIGSATLA